MISRCNFVISLTFWWKGKVFSVHVDGYSIQFGVFGFNLMVFWYNLVKRFCIPGTMRCFLGTIWWFLSTNWWFFWYNLMISRYDLMISRYNLIESVEAGSKIYFPKYFFVFLMISIGFQLDYELYAKNQSKQKHKKWICLFFFDFVWIFFVFWIVFCFFFGSFWNLFFLIFCWISIGFFFGFSWNLIFLISIGFHIWALAKRQTWKKRKNPKPNPILSLFLIFNWFNSRNSSNWNPKKSEQNPKNEENIFLSSNSQQFDGLGTTWARLL